MTKPLMTMPKKSYCWKEGDRVNPISGSCDVDHKVFFDGQSMATITGFRQHGIIELFDCMHGEVCVHPSSIKPWTRGEL